MNENEMDFKQVQTVLFDLDGTLVDSKKSVVQSVYHTSKYYNKADYSLEELEGLFGHSYSDILMGLHPKDVQEPVNRCKQIQMDTFVDLVKPFPYVLEGLINMKKQGLSIGIVTNQFKDVAALGLKTFEFGPLIDVLVTIDDVKEGKPSGELLLKAMDKVSANPDTTLMVGDTKFDILAAQNVNVRSVFLHSYGNTPLVGIQPTYSFATFKNFAQTLHQHMTQGSVGK